MKTKYTIAVAGRNVEYFLSKYKDPDISEETLTLLECPFINLSQPFTHKDLAHFLASKDFAFFIADELRAQTQDKNRRIQIRVSETEQEIIQEKAIKRGFKSTSSFLRELALSS